MKSFLKKFFKITGITVLVLIVLMILIPIFFKDEIAEIVKGEINKNINAKVEFADYGLSLFSDFPDFSFSLEGLTVVGVDTFATDTLASISSFNISIDLFSVFSGDYEINSIEVIEPKLHLIALDSTQVNWNIAKPSEEPEVIEEEVPDTAKFKLALKKFEIEDAEIIYDDREGSTYIEAKEFDYILKGDFTQDLVTLENELGIQSLSIKMSGIKYIKDAIVKIDADIDANLKDKIFTFKENEFQINDLDFGWDGTVGLIGETTDIALTFEAKKTDFKNILSLVPGIYAKNFNDIQTKGQLKFSGYIKGLLSESNLPAFAVSIFVENAMFKYPDLPKSVDNIFIDTKITNPGGSPDNTVIDISKMHCEIAGNPIDIKLKVSTPVSDPQIDGHINGKLNLVQIKEIYPLEEGEELNGMVNTNLEFAGKLSSLDRKEYDKFKAVGQIEITDMNYKSDEFKAGAKIEKLLLKFSPQ
ncbi:MAG: AsmA family protein, partial [Ignavibacteriales bacterium]|nr:AsmA family protein [Ignavibacteriales bacterium]